MLIVLISALLGLIFGSFINVLVIRLNTGKSVGGRSFCVACGHKLSVHDLVPLFSYLLLLGRCRYCKCRISLQYPIVEVTTAILFALSAWVYILPHLDEGYMLVPTIVCLGLIMMLFVAIGAYDIRHKIIPNVLVYPLILLSIIWLAITSATPLVLISADVFFGPIAFIVFGALWYLSDGLWMGFGDAKLVLALGFILGFNAGLSALLIAFWTGAVVGIGMLCISKSAITLKSEIPFAPFLILATIIQMLCPVLFFVT